jgi:tetratricopeptide (TPR) repeat protein
MTPAHRILLLLVAFLMAAPAALGDVIQLKDGSRVEGDLKRTPDGWSIHTADGKTRNIPADAVTSVELAPAAGPSSPQNATLALTSLRRSVEALSDLKQIIDRYQRFIDTTKDPQAQADAKADLAVWTQRKAENRVKYGSRWVSPDEIAGMVLQSSMLAEQARELMRQTRWAEAEQVLQQALGTDPRNAAALYLRGVLLFRQDKLPDARRSFEQVNSINPQHPPTLNNLAVIAWRQNQQPAALALYDQAMQAAGANDYILTNVAEALGTLPKEQQKSPAVAKAAKRFAELDQTLQQQMAQQGLYRWGSRWLDEKKLAELREAEKAIRTKLEDMQAEFEQSKVRIAQIDGQIASNERIMVDLQARSVFRDKDGNVYATQPPQSYYDLATANDQLRAEQSTLKTKLTTLQEQAARLQQQVPVPKFTGIQQIVGVEGMPGGIDPPSTAPATAPTSNQPSIEVLPPNS